MRSSDSTGVTVQKPDGDVSLLALGALLGHSVNLLLAPVTAVTINQPKIGICWPILYGETKTPRGITRTIRALRGKDPVPIVNMLERCRNNARTPNWGWALYH